MVRVELRGVNSKDLFVSKVEEAVRSKFFSHYFVAFLKLNIQTDFCFDFWYLSFPYLVMPK